MGHNTNPSLDGSTDYKPNSILLALLPPIYSSGPKWPQSLQCLVGSQGPNLNPNHSSSSSPGALSDR